MMQSVGVFCDDNTMPPDSILANIGAICNTAADYYGKSVVYSTMKSSIEEAEFINIQKNLYNIPLGG